MFISITCLHITKAFWSQDVVRAEGKNHNVQRVSTTISWFCQSFKKLFGHYQLFYPLFGHFVARAAAPRLQLIQSARPHVINRLMDRAACPGCILCFALWVLEQTPHDIIREETGKIMDGQVASPSQSTHTHTPYSLTLISFVENLNTWEKPMQT